MTTQRTLFNERLSKPGLIVAPGVYEMVSLRLADRMNFDALYMTGYGTVASLLGLPDAGLATYSEMVGRVTAMAGMAKTPLIADGDTGYGGLLNVRHTIRGYEAAGAVAIQLEDQEFPKKCGHTPCNACNANDYAAQPANIVLYDLENSANRSRKDRPRKYRPYPARAKP